MKGGGGIHGHLRPSVTRAAVLTLVLAVAITACGKKGPPLPPGPADQVTYPRLYPAPSKEAPK